MNTLTFTVFFLIIQIGTKFWYVFKLYRSDLHIKINYRIQHIIFYGALQNFLYININCSFLMPQIGTKFWHVFKLHRSDLHTKISHCIQHIFFIGHFKNLNALAFTILFQ